MEYADDIIYVLPVYRIPGIYALIQDEIHCFLKAHAAVEGRHVCAVRHDIRGFLVPQLKDIGYHLCLIRFQDALFMALIDHRHDILLCDVAVVIRQVHPKLLGVVGKPS